MYLLSCWTLLFAVLWGVFGAFGVFPVAVRPFLRLSCPPVPAELGTAHLLPLPSALGMAEPKGSVTAEVPVAAPGVPIDPIDPIYLCSAAGTRAGCAGTHPTTDHALLGRSKPCPVLPEILKCTNRHLIPSPGGVAPWGSSARPPGGPSRAGGVWLGRVTDSRPERWRLSRSVPEEGDE